MIRKTVSREELADSKIELPVYKIKDHVYKTHAETFLEKISGLNHTSFKNGFFQDGDSIIFNESEKYEDGIIDVYHLKNWLELVSNEILEFEIRPAGIYFYNNMAETFFKFRSFVNRDYKSLYLPIVLDVRNKGN